MNKITVNGKTTIVAGNNVSIVNDKVYVDGKLVTEGLSGNVSITFEGDLASLEATDVVINGSVHGPVEGTNIKINGNITGDVKGTNIKASNITGNVKGINVSR